MRALKGEESDFSWWMDEQNGAEKMLGQRKPQTMLSGARRRKHSGDFREPRTAVGVTAEKAGKSHFPGARSTTRWAVPASLGFVPRHGGTHEGDIFQNESDTGF